ncbi:MAG: hypothetical protein H0W50_05085 [Parachlamydiaceae bacterium]|nr:hypothetical protein [Parachlamydiaceae bacterium]
MTGIGIDRNQGGAGPASYGNDAFVNYLTSIRQYIGRAITTVGFHFVPIPIVKDIIELTGTLISGDPFSEHHWALFGENFKGDLELAEPENVNGRWRRVFDVGGICCSAKDMLERAKATSEALGGCNVHYMAFASDGFLLDVGKAFIRNCGIPLPGDQRMYNEIENIANDAGGAENGVMHVKAHSQSGIILNNFSNYTSKDMCKSMSINTFGTAKILDTNRFESVTNHISVNDIVPKVSDPLTYLQACFQPRSDVIFLKSKTLPLIDHPFDGDVYQEANQAVNAKIMRNLRGE